MTAGRDEEVPSTIELYCVFRAYIEHEDDLINHRVSWFIQLHSFLIATYGIVVAAVLAALSSDKPPVVPPILPDLIACAILVAISVVGITSSQSAQDSIGAAHRAINRLTPDWTSIIEPRQGTASLPGLTGGGDPKSVEDGANLHLKLPKRLGLLWYVSFLVPVAFASVATLATAASVRKAGCDLSGSGQAVSLNCRSTPPP